MSIALLLLAAPLPFAKPAPRDPMESLLGSWQRIVYERNGGPVTLVDPDGPPVHLVIEKGVMTWTQGARTHGVWDCMIDPKKKPLAFRMKWRDRDGWQAGTLELEGDTLKMRNAEEGTELGKGYYSVFKRAAKGSR